MTSADSPQGAPDDTAAFQRFYSGGQEAEVRRGLIYRLLVAWWKDR